MRPHYLYLALALVLLWFPAAFLLGRGRRRELRNPARGVLVTLPALLATPWAWIDLLRAGGGTWLMMNLAVRMPLPPDRPTRTALLVMAIGQLVIFLAGVWIQIMVTGSRRLRLAPLFYLLGICAIILPWQVALFGTLLGFTLTAMLRRWALIFWLMPASLLGMALLFKKPSILVAVVVVLHVLPGLLGLRPERPLSWIFSAARARPTADDQPRPRRRRSRRDGGGRPESNDERRANAGEAKLPVGAQGAPLR